MADYHSVLQRAIGNLPQNTGQARREIYDKARKALVRQLESFDPPLPPSEITAQRLALEEAIRRIETEVVRRSATQPRPAAVAPPAPAPRPAPAPAPAPARAEPRPEPVAPVRTPPVERPVREAPAPVPAARPVPETLPEPALPPEPAYVPHPEPVMPEPVAPPVAEARPPRFRRPAPEAAAPATDGETPAQAPDAAAPRVRRRVDPDRPVRPRRERPVAPAQAPENAPADRPAAPAVRPRPPRGADASWAYAEDGQSLPPTGEFDPRLPARDADLPDGEAPPVTLSTERRPAKSRAVRPPADNDFPPRARISPARKKAKKRVNPRLLAIGLAVVALLAVSVGAVYLLTTGTPTPASETADSGEADTPPDAPPPADNADASAPADGSGGKIADRLEDDVKRVPTRRIVTTTPDGEDPAGAADGQTPAAVPMPPAQDGAPAEPAATMSATGDRAILYEEGAAQGSRGSAAVGKVSWKLVQESFANGPKEPMVRASVTIPERKVTVGLLFRQNHDPALPASYLVEITYDLPDNFAGGGITNVPGIIMKASEDSRGDALLGASARVSDGLFWIALAQSPTDVARNDALLRDRNWIDIPMLYANGRRAILTIEKGPEGDKALDAALDAWAKKAN